MNQLLQQFESAILARRLFRGGQRILVAVSGGLDSMVLLTLLHQLASKHRWKLTVAHFNHQLRGQHSDADERLVRKAAEKFNLPITVARADVRKFADQHGLSLEMAARKLRHEFYAKTAARRNIPTVALAHHADDQVELFFLRMFRGTGGDGLGGMKWISPLPVEKKIALARPLLQQPKAALKAYACANKIPFSEDATNASLDIQRNRIRHELIPLLQKQYQPAIFRTVLRSMEVVGAEADFVTEAAVAWMKSGGGQFQNNPVAVQRRVLQLQLFRLRQPVDFEMIERLRAGETIMVGTATTLHRTPDGIVRKKKISAAVFPIGQQELCLDSDGGEVCFSGVGIRWKTEKANGASFQSKPRVEYFDASKIGPAIHLRHWQPGDRFQPIGTDAPRKLQDLFTNLKIPRDERHKRVVASTATGELFWVEGLRISERFKLTEATRRRLKWCLSASS